MRIVISIMFSCLASIGVASDALAQPPVRVIKDGLALSATVNGLLSKNACTPISENPTDGTNAARPAMTFRFRCKGDVGSVSALLNELDEIEWLDVDGIVKHPGVHSMTNDPVVDVRFDVIAIAAIEG